MGPATRVLTSSVQDALQTSDLHQYRKQMQVPLLSAPAFFATPMLDRESHASAASAPATAIHALGAA